MNVGGDIQRSFDDKTLYEINKCIGVAEFLHWEMQHPQPPFISFTKEDYKAIVVFRPSEMPEDNWREVIGNVMNFSDDESMYSYNYQSARGFGQFLLSIEEGTISRYALN